MPHKNKQLITGVICATVGLGLAYVVKKYRASLFKNLKNMNTNEIILVNSYENCQTVVQNIHRKCSEYRVLGFDCEWVTESGKRHPVALMQLALSDGYCALIRLCFLQGIPHALQVLLEDATILKVGVAPMDDARYLLQDYRVAVRGCVDLRHIAKMQPSGGLSGLAKHYLHVELDKSWRVRCSNWEAEELSERQIHYASQDALVAVQIFNKLVRPWWLFWGLPKWTNVYQNHGHLRDVPFKTKTSRASVSRTMGQRPGKSAARSYSTRQRPLYDNCILQAPDGEVLSTCNCSKAEWYVSRGLGQVVQETPLTVRLMFEPSGRAEGDSGKYYTIEKENQCVVCGKTDSYIKKNVVPHEYRRYFPAIMKDHMSHDVLLVCLNCHLRSNSYDMMLRQQLADECNAPIGTQEDVKLVEMSELKKVRSAARALLSCDASRIPTERCRELETIVKEHFGASLLSLDMLEEASHMVISVKNPAYEPHGLRVVTQYAQNGGLLLLEQRWREHFLNVMRPQFLPSLWSVTHNHGRLIQHIALGKIQPAEIHIAGLA